MSDPTPADDCGGILGATHDFIVEPYPWASGKNVRECRTCGIRFLVGADCGPDKYVTGCDYVRRPLRGVGCNA